MFYRFKCGTFIEADTFDDAKNKFLANIKSEIENPKEWHKCTCLGFNHRFGCPSLQDCEVPF